MESQYGSRGIGSCCQITPQNCKFESLENLQFECLNCFNLVKKYENQFDQMQGEIADGIRSKKYGTSGSLLHRGYYSPSPIYDLVVGNVKRGRLLKNFPPQEYAYGYQYDENGKLSIVNLYRDGAIIEKEFIVRKNNVSLGITFEENKKIRCLCKENFQNEQLSQLVVADIDITTGDIWHIEKERYFYNSLGLYICDLYEYYPQLKVVNCQRYTFDHDPQGFITTYTVKDVSLIPGNLSSSSRQEDIYTVKLKRRV